MTFLWRSLPSFFESSIKNRFQLLLDELHSYKNANKNIPLLCMLIKKNISKYDELISVANEL